MENHYLASLDALLTQHAILFQREVDGLTNSQLNFLKAFCSNVKQFGSAGSLHSYRLGRSGNVNRIKQSLEAKEVLVSFNLILNNNPINQ